MIIFSIKHFLFFRGFQTRKKMKESDEDLPDLSCPEVAQAAVNIQRVYRGFQIRKRLKEGEIQEDDLPDLSCPEVATAAVTIQKVYRGFQTRKQFTPSSKPPLRSVKSTLLWSYRVSKTHFRIS